MPSSDVQESTTETNPWGPQIQYLLEGYEQAQNQLGMPREYFPGSTMAAESRNTLDFRGAAGDLMRDSNFGAEYYQGLMRGDMLGPENNPLLVNWANQGASDITRNFKTGFAPGTSLEAAGRSGSPLEQYGQYGAYRALGETLDRHYGGIYTPAYMQEREYQHQAPSLYGAMQGNTRANLMLGAGAGQAEDYRNQSVLGADINRFQFGQDEPRQRLDDYLRRIYAGGVIPGTQEQTISGGGGGIDAAQGAGLGISALGTLAMFCSRKLKDHIDAVEPQEVLDRLDSLPIAIWRYKESYKEAMDYDPHLGPYAEDFLAIFGLGDGKTLAFIDLLGVTMAAVKGAGERIRAQEGRIRQLEANQKALHGEVVKTQSCFKELIEKFLGVAPDESESEMAEAG